ENGSIEDVSCRFSEGEIIGLAGLEGAGQRILLRSISGLTNPFSGSVSFSGEDISHYSYSWHIENGFHYLPADREGEGLIQGLTVTEHFALAENQGSKTINWGKATQLAEDKLQEYAIRGTVNSKPEDLSGGNQQRLLLALMPSDLSVLAMEHPTRGLDIESSEWVWNELLDRSESGTTIIFSSSDIEELINFSDRILVCFAGEIIGDISAKATNPHDVGSLIGGIRI
ncbi:MAG: ATP-binding cassette domain-containing protein, partial [Dehalococcoidia bacterium]